MEAYCRYGVQACIKRKICFTLLELSVPKWFRRGGNFSIRRKLKVITELDGSTYQLFKVTDDHAKLDQYIESMLSRVFSICPDESLPRSSRLYEAIHLGAVPIIPVDNALLPF